MSTLTLNVRKVGHPFFYQSPNGGRVFFDELGPPWPKHPCTDRVLASVLFSDEPPDPIVLQDAEPSEPSRAVYACQAQGWEPFAGKEADGSVEVVRLQGTLTRTDSKLVLYAPRKRGGFGFYGLPDHIMVRVIGRRAERFVGDSVKVFGPGLDTRSVEVQSYRFAAYTGPDWLERDSSDDWARTPSNALSWELEPPASWFIAEGVLPLEPFTLPGGQAVPNPGNCYDGLLAQLRSESDSLYRARRLIEKLAALKRCVEHRS